MIDDSQNVENFKYMVDIYHQNTINIGGAASRNLGVSLAHGDKIMFIDCDDDIYENYIQILLEEYNKNNDLTWISWRCIYGDAVVQQSLPIPNIAPWGCLFKKEILLNNKFNEKLNIGEEPEFWNSVFKISNLKIGFNSNIIYYYNIREDSATRRYQKGELQKER